MSIFFVTFHVDVKKWNRREPPVRHAFEGDYYEAIRLMFQSIICWYPESRRVLLTDTRTNVEFLDPAVQVRRFDIDPTALIFSRLKAQSEFISEVHENDLVIFIDTDMLVQSRLNILENEKFDVAVTVRKKKEMPFNGGLIIARTGRGARNFFDRMRSTMKEQTADKLDWYGDQQALKTIVPPSSMHLCPEVIESSGIRFLILSCDEYNFTPRWKSGDDLKVLPDKKILHFKGRSKPWMRPYFDRFFNCSDNSKNFIK